MNWFNGFIRGHCGRCPRRDWPASADDTRVFFAVWRSEFEAARVTQAEAEAASLAVASAPPQYLDRHLPAVMAKVREARRNAASAGLDGHYDDMTLASNACRECPTCSGSGCTSIPDPDRAGRHVAAFCWCGAGRLVKRLRLQQDPFLAARTRQAPRPEEAKAAEEAVEEHWLSRRDAERQGWEEDAREAYPLLARINPVFVAAAARVGCYRAEVEHRHPWPGSSVYPEPATTY